MPESPVVGQIPAQAENAKPATSASPPDPRPIRALPTDRIIYPKHLQLLRAFAVAHGQTAKPVQNAELATLAKLNVSTVSLNNTFFSEIGLIQKAGLGYVPSAEVISFNRAYSFNAETPGYKLAPILRNSWFAQEILPRLQMDTMSEAEAIVELAEAAKASEKYTPQLRTLLEYLQTSGLIEREGGTIREGAMARADSPSPARSPSPPRDEDTSVERQQGNAESGSTVTTDFRSAARGGVQFNVNVSVDMLEMATWPPEVVAAFMDGLARVISAKAMVERGAGL